MIIKYKYSRFNYVQKISYYRKKITNSSNTGFTLLELLVVIMIVGILSAIAAPSWLNFLNQRRVSAVNEAIWGAIKEAQSEAKTGKVNYSMSFRNENGLPEIAVFETDKPDEANFIKVSNDVDLKPGQVELSSNIATTKAINGTDYKIITFDEIGALDDFNTDDKNALEAEDDGISITAVALNRQGEEIDSTQRCVKVLTLLGSMLRSRGADCP